MANRDMAARFLANPEQKLPPRPEREPKKTSGRAPMKRGRGPAKKKMFQEVPPERRGFWHGEMCAHLRYQEREPGFTGFYRCMCGLDGCNSQIEGFDEARRFFKPGHLKPRSSFNHRGFRFPYVPTLGPDEVFNVVPVDPSHNEKEFWDRHNEQPEWSESA